MDETVVNGQVWMPTKYTQSNAGYRLISPRPGVMCASCRWFKVPMGCQIVQEGPKPILPTGVCNQHTEYPSDEEVNELVEVEMGVRETDQKPEPAHPDAQKTIGKYPPKSVLEAMKPDLTKGVFKALGNGYWFAAFSNNFEDREKEILSRDGWKRYKQRLDAGFVEMPELRVWHVPGSKHGRALYLDLIEDARGWVIPYAVGKFDNTPAGRAAEKGYKANPHLFNALSHGFLYPQWALKEGIYKDFNVFEISTLPREAAANPYTAFTSIKEITMAVDETKKAALEALFGDTTSQVLAEIERTQAAGKALGEALEGKYKDFVDLTAGTAESQEKADKGQTADTNAAFKTLFGDMIETQGTLATGWKAVDARIDALEQQVKARDAKIAELEKLLSTPAGPASKATETVVTEGTEDAAKAVKDKTATASKDPFFGFEVEE